MVAKTEEVYTHPNQQHRNKYISKNHKGYLNVNQKKLTFIIQCIQRFISTRKENIS